MDVRWNYSLVSIWNLRNGARQTDGPTSLANGLPAQINSKVVIVFEYIRHYGPAILLLSMTTSETGLKFLYDAFS